VCLIYFTGADPCGTFNSSTGTFQGVIPPKDQPCTWTINPTNKTQFVMLLCHIAGNEVLIVGFRINTNVTI